MGVSTFRAIANGRSGWPAASASRPSLPACRLSAIRVGLLPSISSTPQAAGHRLHRQRRATARRQAGAQIFAGIYYWFPKMTGRMYRRAARQVALLAHVRQLDVTFFPMHWVGMSGCRAASPTTRTASATGTSSSRSLVRARHLRRAVLLQRDRQLARGPVAESNPWRAMTSSGGVARRRRCSTSTRSAGRGGPYEYGVPGARHAV